GYLASGGSRRAHRRLRRGLLLVRAPGRGSRVDTWDHSPAGRHQPSENRKHHAHQNRPPASAGCIGGRSNKRVTIMSHAEQLERETEQTRTQIANTLDELRTCMTPGHVLDQLADRVSDGAAAAFAQNLKHQTVNNPLPVVLIGAGLAWLMLGPRGSSAGGFMRGTADRLRNATNEATDTMRS